MAGEGRIRRGARVAGVVQGVGLRPAVARMAEARGLGGFVRNEGADVRLAVEGAGEDVAAFEAGFLAGLPAAARVEAVRWTEEPVEGGSGFVVADSTPGSARAGLVPDLAPCAACLAELRDPTNRRFGYPFASCTACGPRFTVAEALPYDRARTTMRRFATCQSCACEYATLRDRRFHAQTVACAACGPRAWLRDARGPRPVADPVDRAREALRDGRVLAVKALGGWQLLVDARDDAAVRRLRAAKARPDKPLAVMVGTLADAEALATLDGAARAALAGPDAPIVLVRRRGSDLAPSVAPGLERVGLMLPSTLVHHLLAEVGPLVCTSANVSEEPTIVDDHDPRLVAMADVLLGHDRPIARRCDDGVIAIVAGAARVTRHGRGRMPAAVALPDGPDLLAVGAHLKCAPAAARGPEAVLWPHVGDMDGPGARDALRDALADLAAFLDLRPVAVVTDAHPEYGSTRVAERLGLPTIPVHHHHAHVAACLAEHDAGAALGVAWDGTGLGSDGTPWGGEFLAVDPAGARRVAFLRPFPLPGGDRAARDGERCLAGVLVALGEDVPPALARHAAVARASGATTSAGRLFDAAAAALGVATRSRFEGDAAQRLEAVADSFGPDAEPYPFRLDGAVVDWGPAFLGLLADRADPPRAAARFHATLAAMIRAVAMREGAGTVALSGGCFQNARLAEATIRALQGEGIRALLPCRNPCGDGGIALGQLWVARHRVTTA